MNPIHMDTEDVRSNAFNMLKISESMSGALTDVLTKAANMDWDSPSKEAFVVDCESFARNFELSLVELKILIARLLGEVDEWELIDSGYVVRSALLKMPSDGNELASLYSLWSKELFDGALLVELLALDANFDYSWTSFNASVAAYLARVALNLEYTDTLAGLEAGVGIAGSAYYLGLIATAAGDLDFDLSKMNVNANLGADVFFGAAVNVSGEANLGPLSLGAEAGFKAGFGANVDATAGFDNGEFSFSLDAGLTFLYGYDLGVELKFNYAKALDAIASIAPGAYEVGKDIVNGVGDAIGDIGDAAEGVVEDIGGGIGDLIGL